MPKEIVKRDMGKRKWQRKRRVCKELIKRGRKGKKTRMKIEIRKKRLNTW